MARIGIFGGSFNPPHLGHLLAVREFQRELALDLVLMIPAAVPPHKKLTENSPSAQHRLEMTRLAAQELPDTRVLSLELEREGESYTADTVEALRREYPHDELFLLMGTDMFFSFDAWYQPQRIAKEVTLAVAHRDKDDGQQLRACAEQLQERFGARTVFVENRYLPHSSTSVRAMLAFDCAESYLPAQVLAYIRENRLYYCGENLKELPFARLAEVSLSLHKAARVAHAAGCSRTAKQLALQYGADVTDAARAGILHDITKALNGEEQLKLCDRYAIVLDNFERENPKLLHAKTGAVIAKQIFGENDAIYEAIYWHTTGKADMSVLEKIIYLADYIEPNRDFPGVEELRTLTAQSLDLGLRRGLELSIAQLNDRGRKIDKNSLAALRFLKERMQTQ
ncbi:MAG: nicotinate (nicotinamide) nucleotide adenylyltransferase [Faecousia sp.]